jgi:hypothetical protein
MVQGIHFFLRTDGWLNDDFSYRLRSLFSHSKGTQRIGTLSPHLCHPTDRIIAVTWLQEI